jgi:uncharacterized protein YciI
LRLLFKIEALGEGANPMSQEDYEAVARSMTSRMLGMKLWVITTTAVAERDKIAPLLQAHLEHQVRLEKQGIMFGAGPLSNPDGSRANIGLIIIRAANAEEARRIADSDPMHQAGVRAYTLHEWTLNEGRLTVSIDFSDQRYRLA